MQSPVAVAVVREFPEHLIGDPIEREKVRAEVYAEYDRDGRECMGDYD